MEEINIPGAYPGSRYAHRITIAGVNDPSTVIAVVKFGQGMREIAEQFSVTTAKTPGARSTDVTISRAEGFTKPGRYWLEISADNRIVRTAKLIISYEIQ